MNFLMERVYSFFGFEFTADNIAFYIGEKGIYWYAIIISLGFIGALVYCSFRAKHFGVDKDKLVDCGIIGLIAGVIGARLYYVLFDWLDGGVYASFVDVIAIWDGGLAIFGGVIFGLLAGGITCKVLKMNVLDAFDLTVMGFLIGQGVGRWGNFVNQEVYGRATNSDWFGIAVDNGFGGLSEMVHPLFLYESLWCIGGFLILHFLTKRRCFKGQFLCFYMMWYSFGRFWLEGMRDDFYVLKMGPFAASQIVSLLIFTAGVILYFVLKNKTPLKEEEYDEIYKESITQEVVENGENN